IDWSAGITSAAIPNSSARGRSCTANQRARHRSVRGASGIMGIALAENAIRDGIALHRRTIYRSISPITMSREPTIAGISPSKKSLQMGLVIDRLQKHELLARARKGFASPLPTM